MRFRQLFFLGVAIGASAVGAAALLFRSYRDYAECDVRWSPAPAKAVLH